MAQPWGSRSTGGKGMRRAAVGVAVLCLILAVVAFNSGSEGRGGTVLEEKKAPTAQAEVQDWDDKIKEIEQAYKSKVAAEKATTAKEMKAEEQHMITKMEAQKKEEEEELKSFRMEEERKETVVLAKKKASDIEEAEAQVRAKEAKTVKVLEAKLSALHSLASRLGDDADEASKGDSKEDKKKEEEDEEKKEEEQKKEKEKEKEEEEKKKEKEAKALSDAQLAHAKAAAAAREKEMSSKLSSEVQSLDEESTSVQAKIKSAEEALQAKPKIKRVDAFDVLLRKVSEKSQKAKCTEADCPAEAASSIIDKPGIIHEVAKMAQNGEGKSKQKAMAFVKNLQEQIDDDYKSVMGFGTSTVKTAEHIFEGGAEKHVAASMTHDAFSESNEKGTGNGDYQGY